MTLFSRHINEFPPQYYRVFGDEHHVTFDYFRTLDGRTPADCDKEAKQLITAIASELGKLDYDVEEPVLTADGSHYAHPYFTIKIEPIGDPPNADEIRRRMGTAVEKAIEYQRDTLALEQKDQAADERSAAEMLARRILSPFRDKLGGAYATIVDRIGEQMRVKKDKQIEL